jgi:hypothetical protein
MLKAYEHVYYINKCCYNRYSGLRHNEVLKLGTNTLEELIVPASSHSSE